MKYSLNKSPHIAILMCTYNGEAYLKEQLDSIKNQDYKNWKLYINDDGSKDTTLDILKAYQKKWGNQKLIIRRGPQKGFCQNFLNIINDKKIKADLYFLSDQDDIWMLNKISHAIKKLSKYDLSKPTLYCARTTYISNDAKKIIGHSDNFLMPPSFKNAIIQSIAGGNTMAFNNALRNLVNSFRSPQVVSHDWWLYIVNELWGGKTFYDKEPTIFYRQHSKSLIGANTGFLAKLKRFKMLLKGVYRQYNTKNLEALRAHNFLATNDNFNLINQFYTLRDKGVRMRISMVKDLGIYRQTVDGQIALYIATILHKL